MTSNRRVRASHFRVLALLLPLNKESKEDLIQKSNKDKIAKQEDIARYARLMLLNGFWNILLDNLAGTSC